MNIASFPALEGASQLLHGCVMLLACHLNDSQTMDLVPVAECIEILEAVF